MNTKILDKIIKSRDDKNRKATLPNKIKTWSIVIGVGLFSTVLNEYKENRNQGS